METNDEEIWDYIIVGGGILGVASAKTLKEEIPDSKILIIEKFPDLGQGNTIRSNAAYRNIFDTDLNIILSTASNKYYNHIQNELNFNLEMQEFGYLWLLDQYQFDSKNAKTIPIKGSDERISLIDFLMVNQIDFEIIRKDKLKNLLPQLKIEFTDKEITSYNEYHLGLKNIEYGFLGKECGVISPDLITKFYKAKFLESGGELKLNTKITRILLKGRNEDFDIDFIPTVWKDLEIGAVEYVDEAGRKGILKTKKLVITTGAWINQLLIPIGIDPLIKAKKRQLFTICSMSTLVKNEGFTNPFNTIPFTILPVGGVFIKPVPFADCIIVGCSDDIGQEFLVNPRDEAKLDDPKGDINFYIYNILPVLEAYFPKIFHEKVKVEQPSAGNYAYSPDRFPIVQRDPNLTNLYFSSGASGSGIMKGDSIARILVACIQGKEFAELFGGFKVKVSDFSLNKRNLPHESLVL